MEGEGGTTRKNGPRDVCASLGLSYVSFSCFFFLITNLFLGTTITTTSDDSSTEGDRGMTRKNGPRDAQMSLGL
jgi:hypothetical protein